MVTPLTSRNWLILIHSPDATGDALRAALSNTRTINVYARTFKVFGKGPDLSVGYTGDSPGAPPLKGPNQLHFSASLHCMSSD